MNINLHIMNANGRLTPYMELSKKALKETIKRIEKSFPINNLDVAIFDSPETAIPEFGMGGYTVNPNYITISVDPKNSNISKVYYEELIDTLAHEFHHVARWRTVGYGRTLLEAMITEGLADYFANEVTGRKGPHLWDNALDKRQIEYFLKKAEKDFNNKNYNHTTWFFGSKDKKIPKWTAYSLGYFLVGEYLKKHPDKKASNLYAQKAEEIMKS